MAGGFGAGERCTPGQEVVDLWLLVDGLGGQQEQHFARAGDFMTQITQQWAKHHQEGHQDLRTAEPPCPPSSVLKFLSYKGRRREKREEAETAARPRPKRTRAVVCASAMTGSALFTKRDLLSNRRGIRCVSWISTTSWIERWDISRELRPKRNKGERKENQCRRRTRQKSEDAGGG